MFLKCSISFVHVLVFVSLVKYGCYGDSSFSDVLQKLANDVLGVQKFQDYLDTLPQNQPNQLNGSDFVSSITDGVGKRLQGYTAVLQKLRDAAVQDLNKTDRTNDTGIQNCCNLTTSGMATDPGLKTTTDRGSLCRISETSSSVKFEKTLQTMIENMNQEPTIKWQYFGGNDGLMNIYPATNQCVDKYDPRLRPWYYATASPTPKDILIAIQVSSSMSDLFGTAGITKLSVAMNAAQMIIGSLNPNDRISVLAFAESRTFADECFKNSLAYATPQNKAKLQTFVSNLKALQEVASVDRAVKDAFLLFSNSSMKSTESNRVRMLFLLTDGKINASETTDQISCTVKSSNRALNNSVSIMAFGIDPAMGTGTKVFLQMLTQQNFTAACNGSTTDTIKSAQEGKFINLQGPEENYIKGQIGLIFDIFRTSTPDQAVFTVPYFDSLGLGLVMTACLPVIISTELKGITCIDFSLDIVLNDVINFKLGQLSYAFLIDGHGKALIHPSINLPDNYKVDPTFINIDFLETSDGSQEILQSMKSGGTGSKRINASLVVSRGSNQLEGVDQLVKAATYYWHPVSIIKASVCLVIIDGESQPVRVWSQTDYPPVLLAEHIDIFNLTNPELCAQWQVASTGNRSMVKLAPMAFVEPFSYSLVNNSKTPETETLTSYLEGKSNSTGTLAVKRGVREAVALTYALEDIWKSTADTSYWIYTLFRYIGTEEGVFRKLPGTVMAKQYDPTRRPWYTAALGSGLVDKITVSKPYTDTSGKIVLTLCKTVYEGSKTAHSSADPVFGVLGLDMTLESFYNLLVNEFTPCKSQGNRCFVIDRSGFIIVHADYTTNALPKAAEHITVKEPQIAYELTTNSVMNNDTCTDYTSITTSSFLKIEKTEPVMLAHCQVYPVNNSNLYVIVIPTNNTNQTLGACTCDTNSGECSKNEVCQCPCHSGVDYNLCTGTFQTTQKQCLPSNAPLSLPGNTMSVEQGKFLPDCRPCDVTNLFTTQRSCEDTKKCCWQRDTSVCRYTCSSNTSVSEEPTRAPYSEPSIATKYPETSSEAVTGHSSHIESTTSKGTNQAAICVKVVLVSLLISVLSFSLK